jgi:hypothetical protein
VLETDTLFDNFPDLTLETFNSQNASESKHLVKGAIIFSPSDLVKSSISSFNNPETYLEPFSVIRLILIYKKCLSAYSLIITSWLKTNLF